MKQCPDCEAKDRVVIASKVFCANCGTPWQPADPKEMEAFLDSTKKPSNEQAQSPSQPAQTTAPTSSSPPNPAVSGPNDSSQPDVLKPAIPVNQPAPVQSSPDVAPVNQPAPAPITPDVAQSPLDAVNQSSDESLAVAATSVHAPKTQPASPVSADSSNTPATTQVTGNIKIKKTVDRLDSAKQIEKSSSIDKFHQPSTVAASIQPNQAPSQEEQPTTQDLASTPVANIGSEMPELETKDQPLLSDGQFSQLEEIKKEQPEIRPPDDSYISTSQSESNVMPTESTTVNTIPSAMTPTVSQPTATVQPPPATSPAPINPIVPTQSSAPVMTDISRPASAPVSNPLPGQTVSDLIANQTPTTDSLSNTLNLNSQPASATTPSTSETTTVAGLTMSKEAAMKLALDANVSQPTGEQSIGKAFRPGSVALSIVGLILIGAYIWQINYPNLALKVASNRAGVTTSLPNYLPSGWKLAGPIQSKPGQVNYSLADVKKDHELSVTATKTDWDSQALADNYITPRSDNYLALQAQGLTIYLYGDNQASWVNGEKWYRLEGNSHGLSQEQIIKMATSL